jgi:hypothetical protein
MSGPVCYSCKRAADPAYTDPNGLAYCDRCAEDVPGSGSVATAVRFLAATIPYRPGDRVECRTGGIVLDGTGSVDGISFTLEEGGGTPVTPVFHVTIDEPAYADAPDAAYYPECCLKRVER